MIPVDAAAKLSDMARGREREREIYIYTVVYIYNKYIPTEPNTYFFLGLKTKRNGRPSSDSLKYLFISPKKTCNFWQPRLSLTLRSWVQTYQECGEPWEYKTD